LKKLEKKPLRRGDLLSPIAAAVGFFENLKGKKNGPPRSIGGLLKNKFVGGVCPETKT
jgi:hypothetical protein